MYLPKATNEKNGTCLLINKEDSSDEELASKDGYDSLYLRAAL